MANSAIGMEGESFYKNAGAGEGVFSWILSWIFSTDHKRIGILYLISVLALFLTGVVLGFLIRLELLTPGLTIMGPQAYNSAFTLHGVIMLFLFIIPAAPGIFSCPYS